MAKKENKFKGYDISTQAVHTGAGYDAETGAVRRPLHMANSYKLPDQSVEGQLFIDGFADVCP